MSDTHPAKAVIESLVRKQLGCTCPDEVFTSIQLEKDPPVLRDLAKGDLLVIGEKLLVYLVRTRELTSIAPNLGEILQRGQKLRNEGGYNRFRLVIGVPDIQPAQQYLMQQFEILNMSDEKLHLHIIENDQLPEL